MSKTSTKHQKLYIIKSKETNDEIGIIAAEYETDQYEGMDEEKAACVKCYVGWKNNSFENGSVWYPIFIANIKWDAEANVTFPEGSHHCFFMTDNYMAYMVAQHYLDFVARDILGQDFNEETEEEEFKLWDSFQEVLQNHTYVQEFLDKDIKKSKVSFKDIKKLFDGETLLVD